ncbi:MAG TPA: SDR family oxidoreductase [Candidatus Paceibacterota bacterium]|jgi:3-oxoacyl-[acyl-carrier protein] reductase|nr:SDR family oxidoreductase [Candidatus Paceibacterota bacterium]
MNLKDKIIIITGGSRGLGKALAQAFLNEGSKVVISSSNEKEIQNTANEIDAFGICADVTKEEDLTSLANETIKKFGQIDIWVNNAGLWMGNDFAENFDMDKVRTMFDVNVIGTINGTRVALRYMKEKGIGTIVNIISTSALAGRPTLSTYCASKWAVNGFTKSIREENDNISVLSVYPGGMKTNIFGDSKPDDWDSFMDPEYVAQKVVNNLKLENPEKELVIQRPIKN